MSIVVLVALRDELDEARAPDGVRVIHTGVGKVNAASVAMAALLTYKPALVINYGTAGKLDAVTRGPCRSLARDPARHDGNAAGAARHDAADRGAA